MSRVDAPFDKRVEVVSKSGRTRLSRLRTVGHYHHQALLLGWPCTEGDPLFDRTVKAACLAQCSQRSAILQDAVGDAHWLARICGARTRVDQQGAYTSAGKGDRWALKLT